MRIPSRRRLMGAALLGWLALADAPASAHAIVIAATPAADAVVHGARLPIELRFNSRIDRARSRLSLIGPDSATMPLPLARDSAPDTLAAAPAGLAPGRYRLRWQVLAVDGHITRGDIPFDVAE